MTRFFLVDRAAVMQPVLALVWLTSGCGGGGSNESARDSGVVDEADAAPSDNSTDDGPTQLSGTLGSLGEVKPTVSSFVISNSGETLIYLSSAPLTCELLMQEGGKWLSKVDQGSQVIEIVVKGTPKLGITKVGPAEVNYAPGGKSSSYEESASTGSVTFTTSEAKGVVAGTVSAVYSGPKGNVEGTFHAEFCAGGQQY